MISFNFEIDETAHREATEELRDKSKQVLFLTVNKFKDLASSRAPVDTGNLAGSIAAGLTPKTPGHSKYTVTDGTNYGIYVEEGTKPHMPPVDSLRDWARRVLGDEEAAWAVAKSIEASGTQPQKFWATSYADIRDRYLDEYKDLVFRD